MQTVIDDSLMSRRRSIETAGLISRSIGILSTAIYASGLTDYAPHDLSPGMELACWSGILAMFLSNLLAFFGRRRPGSRWYTPFSALQVTLDTATIVAFVVISSLEYPQTTWPLLILTIAIAALRHRLVGAFAAYTLTSAAFLIMVPDSPDHSFVIGVGFMIAVITGAQSAAYSKQLLTLQAARQALHHQANHDSLTGLPNRAQLAGYAAERTGSTLAVLLLDLNGFKQVNDVHGHAAGDLLLHEMGVRLNGVLGPGDLAGRLGGDEFLVLLPEADAAKAAQIGDKIRDVIRRPVDIGDGRQVTVGASVGVALRAAGSDATLDTLTAEADTAMYQDKRAPGLAA
ncbi:diguanylate cyclase domain-containing protein [Actinoplanes sp. CA-015351]|uniref:diguanylate cyclase domain-containing protein n=1 Tax=Actinoplanes sp. CA-015351 TaxID=3239897 RepID=UPI003D97C235